VRLDNTVSQKKKSPIMLSTLGLFIGLVLMIVGIVITTLAAKSLPPEKKKALIAARRNPLGFVPLIIIIAAYYLALNSNIDSQVLLIVYFFALAAIIVIFEVRDSKKIRALELDSAYVRQSSIGRMVNFAGIAIILVAIIPGRG
jgi:hypothetical protein